MEQNHYDNIEIMIPKGMREKVGEYARSKGMTVNRMIKMLLMNEIGIEEREWGFAVGVNPYLKIGQEENENE